MKVSQFFFTNVICYLYESRHYEKLAYRNVQARNVQYDPVTIWFYQAIKTPHSSYWISRQTTITFPLNVYWLKEFTPLLAASDLTAEYCRVISYLLQLKKSSCLPYDHKLFLILFFGFLGRV